MSDVLWTILAINLLGVLSPGPDMLLMIRYGSKTQRFPVVMCMAGILSGLTVHALAAVFGLSLLLSHYPQAFDVIRYLGAAYLIYLGIKAWRARHLQVCLQQESAQGSAWQGYREGLLCNLLNPKVLMFITAIFSQVVAPQTAINDKLLYALTLIVETAVVLALLVVLFRLSGLAQAINKRQRLMNTASSGVLITLGGLLGFNQ